MPEKDGEPVAALIDARLFEHIQRIRARTETADAWRAAGRLPARPARRAKDSAKAAIAKRARLTEKSKASR
jgi:hypothetical protein